jgi:hypothetical protein
MFRKIVSTYLLLAMTAVGTGSMVRMGQAAPAVQSVSQTALPSAPVASARQSLSLSAPLSAAQMSADQGAGWLSKLWKKFKKVIIKIVWQIIKEIIDGWVTSQTTEASSAVSGTVTENYEGTDTDETVYASQADYDANNVQSTSFTDGGYAYQYTDYSAGYYTGGGEY